MTEEVRPAGARLEGWGLLAATLVVLAALTLYVRANGREDTRAVLYDWQISAFDGLQGPDQAIYNSLYTVKDEIPIIFDDINGTKYKGPDLFVQLSTGLGAPVLHDVKINHITAFPKSTSMMIGDVPSLRGQMRNLVFTNNILGTGTYPVWSTGSGGTGNCAAHNSPLTTFKACFSSYTFAGNVIVSSPSNYPPSTWPPQNYFASSPATRMSGAS